MLLAAANDEHNFLVAQHSLRSAQNARQSVARSPILVICRMPQDTDVQHACNDK